MKCFVPLRIYLLPFFTAVVCMALASDPAAGSVIPNAASFPRLIHKSLTGAVDQGAQGRKEYDDAVFEMEGMQRQLEKFQSNKGSKYRKRARRMEAPMADLQAKIDRLGAQNASQSQGQSSSCLFVTKRTRKSVSLRISVPSRRKCRH